MMEGLCLLDGTGYRYAVYINGEKSAYTCTKDEALADCDRFGMYDNAADFPPIEIIVPLEML